MCFAHDAGYSDSKKLTWIIQQDITLKDRAYEIARNCNYEDVKES